MLGLVFHLNVLVLSGFPAGRANPGPLLASFLPIVRIFAFTTTDMEVLAENALLSSRTFSRTSFRLSAFNFYVAKLVPQVCSKDSRVLIHLLFRAPAKAHNLFDLWFLWLRHKDFELDLRLFGDLRQWL